MKRVILIVVLALLSMFLYFRKSNENYYDLVNAVSGATPLAVDQDVPADVGLRVDGMVKQTYIFSSSALGGFASIRFRLTEKTRDNEFAGAYAYTGIPVFNILEGITPEKPETFSFDQPVDLLVEFISDSGDSVKFSYNELIMVNDNRPVTLCYHRAPIEPTNERVQADYKGNLFTEPLSGLRLVAPKDSDTRRYLDNVVKITLSTFDVPESILPVRDKKRECSSNQLICINDNSVVPSQLMDVPRFRIDDWEMIGHGHGYDKTVSIEGYELRSFLKDTFRSHNPDDFYLFVACDGYRCLFSGYEIFRTSDGLDMLIVDTMNDEQTKRGFRLASPADFFADRSMWGLSHVVRIAGD